MINHKKRRREQRRLDRKRHKASYMGRIRAFAGHNGGSIEKKAKNGEEIVQAVPEMNIGFVPRRQFGFPQEIATCLRYATSGNIDSQAGVVGKYFFSTNSLHDPDRTGTGHQPLYYDQYSAIYNHYAVVSSRIYIEFANTNASVIGISGVCLEDDATGSTDIGVLREMNFSKSKFLHYMASSQSVNKYKLDWNCTDVLGIDPVNDQQYKTTIGSNPVEESFFTLFWYSATAGADDYAQFQVIIEYNVIFSELKTPTAS